MAAVAAADLLVGVILRCRRAGKRTDDGDEREPGNRKINTLALRLAYL